jgi:hypothetical protein
LFHERLELLLALDRPGPNDAGPRQIGKPAHPAELQREGGRLGTDLADQLADIGNDPIVDIAKELQREVQILGWQPLRPWHGFGKSFDQLTTAPL